MKTYVHRKNCSWMLIVALFIKAQTWKQPKHPSTGEETNPELLLRNKGKLIHITTWTNLKYIMLSERNQTQKATLRVIPCTWHSCIDKKQTSGCQGLGLGIGGNYKGVWGSFRGRWKCSWLWWQLHDTMCTNYTVGVHSYNTQNYALLRGRCYCI